MKVGQTKVGCMFGTTSRTATATMVAVMSLVAIGSAQTYTTFELPNAEFTEPWAINSAGVIVGYYGRPDHGFLRETDGTLVTFDGPLQTGTIPQAINPAGQIAGYYTGDTVPHGFLREPDGTSSASIYQAQVARLQMA